MKADKRTLFCLAILIITFLASCSLAVTPRDPVEGDLAVKPSPVAAPTVTVTDRTAGSGNVTLSLSWEAVEGATQYEVLYQSEDQIFEGDWSSHRVSTNSASLTLTANEVFRITVVASNGYSSSDEGGYALVSTITTRSLPSSPQAYPRSSSATPRSASTARRSSTSSIRSGSPTRTVPRRCMPMASPSRS